MVIKLVRKGTTDLTVGSSHRHDTNYKVQGQESIAGNDAHNQNLIRSLFASNEDLNKIKSKLKGHWMQQSTLWSIRKRGVIQR